jgi:cytochrome b561
LPKSDFGTVVIHWAAVGALVASLLTGLRIAADALDSRLAAALSPWLPEGEVWSVHIAAGLALAAIAGAYAVYVLRSGVSARLSAGRVRAMARAGGAKQRWGVASVALHWALFALLAAQTATGVLLYLGHGGWVVAVHAGGAFGVLGYAAAHILSHLAYGGWRHVLRIVRPAPVPSTWRRRRPLALGALAALAVAGGVAAADFAGRDALPVRRAEAPPVLDGLLDDEAWRRALPVIVRTHQGANLAGTGASAVEVRAVHDGGRIHFAFRWSDPSRSLRHLPLVKREDGWHLLHERYDIQDESAFYEDKFAVAFSPSPAFGGGGSSHLGQRPLEDRPGGLGARGLHYTTDGGVLDIWHWKATRGGLLGVVDDNHFGPPLDPKPGEAAGTERYTGGYRPDPGSAFYANNFGEQPPGGFRGPVEVRRLPRDAAATAAATGLFDPDPRAGVADGARWWMTEEESVPYGAEADAAIPVGAVIPGVLVRGRYAGDRADVVGAARWADGHWTLEASRALRTGSRFDQDFAPGAPVYMWVSVFDHSQTRHTRHPRPVRLDLR